MFDWVLNTPLIVTTQRRIKSNEMICAIYHLNNLKNVKNTHGGVLTLLKNYSSMGVFHVFYIAQMVPNRATHHTCLRQNKNR